MVPHSCTCVLILTSEKSMATVVLFGWHAVAVQTLDPLSLPKAQENSRKEENYQTESRSIEESQGNNKW